MEVLLHELPLNEPLNVHTSWIQLVEHVYNYMRMRSRNSPIVKICVYRSLVPKPSPAPFFDRLQYAWERG